VFHFQLRQIPPAFDYIREENDHHEEICQRQVVQVQVVLVPEEELLLPRLPYSLLLPHNHAAAAKR
jgi:hypothetical protein